MPNFFHITQKSEWAQSEKHGEHITPSLQAEGFIHCSFRQQVCATAERHFKARPNLILLEIDPLKVKAEIKYEGAREKYPHIYGPLNLSAIVEVLEFSCLPDGSFELPEVLLGQGHL